MRIRSDPPGAELFLDWRPIGTTPYAFPEGVSGLLVAAKDGYRAAFREFGRHHREREVVLKLEREGDAGGMLRANLVGQVSDDRLSVVRELVSHEGIVVIGNADAAEFRRELEHAGTLANRAFRAWARARFGADVFVHVSGRAVSHPVSADVLVRSNDQAAARGIQRAAADVRLEAISLRTGSLVAACAASAQAFALDPAESADKAWRSAAAQAVAELAAQLRRPEGTAALP